MGQGFLVEEGCARLGVIEHGNGHPPGTLARDAPVGAIAHHGGNPVLARGRNPPHGLDRLQRLVAEALDRGKPLLGGPVDGGLFGAPVVGVLVDIGFVLEQRPRLLQRFDHRWVGVLQHV